LKKNFLIKKIKTISKVFWQNRLWYIKRFSWYSFTLFPQVMNIFYHPGTKIPFSYKHAGTFCNEAAEWYWDANDQLRIRQGILAKAKKSKKYSAWFLAQFLGHFINLEKVFSRLEKLDFNKLTDKELLAAADELYWTESPVAAWGYLADSFLTSGEDNWLVEEIRKEVKNSKAVEILTAAGFESFVNQERADLLKIGTRKKDDAKYFEAMQRHRDNFYWIQNSYWVVYNHKLKFFAGEIEKLKKEGVDFKKAHRKESRRAEINLKAKQEIYKKLHISNKLKNTIYCSDIIGYIQDARKQAALRLDHFLFLLAGQIAKRVKITRQEALNLVYPEIKEALIGKKVDRQELRNRIKKCFIYLSPNGYKILSGKKAMAINENIFHGQEDESKMLKGTPTFLGLVRGRARVVNNHKDMALFKQGEILVTNNTTPEFVPLMKKAKAIVTEQGGMTNHAAIVSRELRVVCIVGVSGITRVLKTGDLVEVDADKGIVKIIYK